MTMLLPLAFSLPSRSSSDTDSRLAALAVSLSLAESPPPKKCVMAR